MYVSKRTSKFYFKNEKEVMKQLGLKPTIGSGSQWIEKEDGENEHYIVQLKSTDNSSYSVNLLDLEKLEYHASVSHKIPLFVIQFFKTNKLYALVNIEDLEQFSFNEPTEIKINKQESIVKNENVKKIKTSKKARDNFYKEREEQIKWKNKK